MISNIIDDTHMPSAKRLWLRWPLAALCLPNVLCLQHEGPGTTVSIDCPPVVEVDQSHKVGCITLHAARGGP
jgi:hypothetical protein